MNCKTVTVHWFFLYKSQKKGAIINQESGYKGEDNGTIS